jgi:hypothetical protein
MITLNFFDSNGWYSFREINDLKSVNKLYFVKITKKWANLVFIIFTLFTFQIRKNIKVKFTLVVVKN